MLKQWESIMKAILNLNNKPMWIINTRKSYGGNIVYEAVEYTIAEKYNFVIPPFISGMYYESQLTTE